MLEILVHKLLNPKTLARLVTAWVVVTVALSAVGYGVSGVSAKPQRPTKISTIQVEPVYGEKVEKVEQKAENSENSEKNESADEIATREFMALLDVLGEQVVQKQTTKLPENIYQKPVRIVVPSKKIDVTVLNPNTTDISQLDDALKKGAVRYPTSGLLGEQNRAVVIFGHTSYVPGFYGYYRTFNGVEKLQPGEEVVLHSNDKIYTYKVSQVKKIKADSDISLAAKNNKLVLITCDGFGSKNVRYMVEADLIAINNK